LCRSHSRYGFAVLIGTGVWITSDYCTVAGNYIGTAADGVAPLGNDCQGVYVVGPLNVIQDNRIACTGQQVHGVQVDAYPANTLRRNAIWGNEGAGVLLAGGGNRMLAAPVLAVVTPGEVTGTACAGCTVEVFSDDEDEGRLYEGTAIADAAGHFVFDRASPLSGPYLTATATDVQGNPSEFPVPAAPVWRLYLPLVLRGPGGQ
jgi:hypothetical protein